MAVRRRKRTLIEWKAPRNSNSGGPRRPEKANSAGFVPVRVTPPTTAATACRIRHPSGWTIECASFPENLLDADVAAGRGGMMRPVGDVQALRNYGLALGGTLAYHAAAREESAD